MSVTIVPDYHNPGETTRIAQLLVAAADDPRDIVTESGPNGTVFVVPDELAAKVKLNTEPASTDEDPAAPAPKGQKRKADK